MTDRIMYDSTDARKCPPGADIYAGYIDGTWQSFLPLTQLFPGAEHCRIAAQPDHGPADMGDFERFDLDPAYAPIFVHQQWAFGILRPCCYVNRDNVDAVDLALFEAGVPTDRACFLIATLDGTMVAERTTKHGYTVVGCQTRDVDGLYDLSVIFDPYFPANPPAGAPVPSSITGDEDMDYLFQRQDGGAQFFVHRSGLVVYVPDQETWNNLRGAGVREVVVGDAFADALKSKAINPPQ